MCKNYVEEMKKSAEEVEQKSKAFFEEIKKEEKEMEKKIEEAEKRIEELQLGESTLKEQIIMLEKQKEELQKHVCQFPCVAVNYFPLGVLMAFANWNDLFDCIQEWIASYVYDGQLLSQFRNFKFIKCY